MSSEAPAVKTPWYRNPWVVAGIAGMITIPLLRPLMRQVPDPPPIEGNLPSDWQLIDQDGNPFGSADLEGETWVANMFFTSCPSVCPPLMQAAKELHDWYERTGIPVRQVSVSVDPNNDTPERLRAYGEELGVDFERWTLLTGDEAEIRRLVVDGFMTAMGDPEAPPEPGADPNLIDISHSAKLIIVDRSGGLRGYYENTETGIDEVYHRSQHVLNEGWEERR